MIGINEQLGTAAIDGQTHSKYTNAVEMAYNVVGKRVVADHGYFLYSSICKHLDFLHLSKSTLIGRITGTHCNGFIYFNPSSMLPVRCQENDVVPLIKLCGKIISIGSEKISVGAPTIRPLEESEILFSRIVVISPKDKSHVFDLEQFIQSVKKQLENLGIQNASVEVPERNGIPVTRTLCIKGKKILGHPVLVGGLTKEESLIVQASGVGGKRKMGAGFFVPSKQW